MSKASQNPELLLERLEWTVLRRLDGLLQGEYRTLFKGAGLDLADLREYAYNDDVRRIDWNVTARLDRPYVREYTEDREVTAWFLCDLTPSVDFGSGDREKRELVTEFVALLARMLSRRGNRVGALLYNGSGVRLLPARSGRNNLLMLIDEIRSVERLDHSPPTDLSRLLDTANKILRRRSLVFLVSDFYSEPGWERSLGLLAQRHEALAVHVFDPLEVELPNLGMITMSDAESGGTMLVDTGDAALRKRFADIAEEHNESIRSSLVRAGVPLIEVSTTDDIANALIRFVLMRKRQGDQRANGRVR